LVRSAAGTQAAYEDVALARAVARVGHIRRVAQDVIQRFDIELLQVGPGDHLNRNGYVLEVLLASVGSDNHLAQFILRRDIRPGLRAHFFDREDADALRREVFEAQSGALQQARERLIGTQAGCRGVGSTVAYDLRDINQLQTGLAGERCECLRQRARGNVGREQCALEALGQGRWSIQHRSGSAEAERTEYSRDSC